MFVNSGERHPAPRLPERKAESSKSIQRVAWGGVIVRKRTKSDVDVYVRPEREILIGA